MNEIICFIDVSDWLTQLDLAYARAKRAGWEFLFVLRAGVEQFGRNDPERMQMYENAATQLNLSVKTLQNYVSIVRNPVAQKAIELDLEIGHADAVLGLTEERAEDVLSQAAERGLTVAQTRYLAWGQSAPQPVSSSAGQLTAEVLNADWLTSDVVAMAHNLHRQLTADQVDILIAELVKLREQTLR